MYQPLNKEQLQAIKQEVEVYMASLPQPETTLHREILQIDHVYCLSEEAYAVYFHEWNEQGHSFTSLVFTRNVGKLTPPPTWSYFPVNWK